MKEIFSEVEVVEITDGVVYFIGDFEQANRICNRLERVVEDLGGGYWKLWYDI